MQDTVQTLRLERGFGFLQDSEGIKVVFHHGALPSPDHFASLAVGVVVGFEAGPSPTGPCATVITTVPAPHR